MFDYEAISRIGRNAPCLCGSGKKFKKCCLPKLETRLTTVRDGQAVFRGGSNNKALMQVMEGVHAARTMQCILCGSEPHASGAFIPTPEFAEKIGQPKGKLRTLYYAICKRCMERPDSTKAVEQVFEIEMGNRSDD